MRKTSRVLAAAAAVATALTMTAGQATAEPAFDPGKNDVVGVGSDTTELYLQFAANSFNVGLTRDDIRLATFDATDTSGTGSPNITIRPGVVIARPNGSGSGINALLANPGIDFARSSRGKNTSATNGEQNLDFIAFASDTQRYATATTSNVPDGLTAAQLRQIYTCTSTDQPNLVPEIPQAGSGSRAFFLASIGLTEAQLAANTSCTVTVVQENDPGAVVGKPNALVPFSVGRFGSGQSGAKLNTTGYAPMRTLYNVVRGGALASPALLSVFGTVDDGGFLCNNPKIISAAGFQPIATCGQIS